MTYVEGEVNDRVRLPKTKKNKVQQKKELKQLPAYRQATWKFLIDRYHQKNCKIITNRQVGNEIRKDLYNGELKTVTRSYKKNIICLWNLWNRLFTNQAQKSLKHLTFLQVFWDQTNR